MAEWMAGGGRAERGTGSGATRVRDGDSATDTVAVAAADDKEEKLEATNVTAAEEVTADEVTTLRADAACRAVKGAPAEAGSVQGPGSAPQLPPSSAAWAAFAARASAAAVAAAAATI